MDKMRKALLEIRAQFGSSVFEGQVLTGYARDQYPEMEKAELLMLRQAEADQLPRRLKRLLTEPEASRDFELVRMRRAFKVDNGFDDRATSLFDILCEVYGLTSPSVPEASVPEWATQKTPVAPPPSESAGAPNPAPSVPLPSIEALSPKHRPPTPAPIAVPSLYTETIKGVSFTMIAVKGGEFTMGDMFGEDYDNETQHQVTLSDYFLGETLVTQGLWKAVMGSNPSRFSGSADLPVEMVSWETAQRFIAKLNEMTGKSYRLPTESEWEYAARERGRKVRFGNGKDVANPKEMNFLGSNVQQYSVKGIWRKQTTPVKQFTSNALGLYDMSGNVWEWCSDWLGDYPRTAQKNPKGPKSASHRVARGGSWNDDPRFCRVSFRGNFTPGHQGGILGFRLASQ